MGRIIVFSGLKDGVGKTCLSSHIAYLLAHCGYKVLLVDADNKHHELTKRMFGSSALLKIIEYKDVLYTTLRQILSEDLPDSFPFSELALPLWQNSDKNAGSLFLIPSYYREPQPFWQQNFSDFSTLPGLSPILAFGKTKYDFVLIDTIVNQDIFFSQMLEYIDSVILVSSPYSYFYSHSLEYIEHFSLGNFPTQYQKILFFLCENMVLGKKEKGSIPFSQDFLAFEIKRNSHRKKFFWDTFSIDQDFNFSSKQWTISMILLLQEILDQTQQNISKIKMPLFLQSFTTSHPTIDSL